MQACIFLNVEMQKLASQLVYLMRSAGISSRVAHSLEEAQNLIESNHAFRFLVTSDDLLLPAETLCSINDALIPIVFVNKKSKVTQKILSTEGPFHFCLPVLGTSIQDNRVFLSLLKRLSQGLPFQLPLYLEPHADLTSQLIYSAQDKSNCVEHVVTYVQGLGENIEDAKFRGFAFQIQMVLEELLMNAIFHANPRLKLAQRSQKYQLLHSERVCVKWGCDGKTIACEVTDYFGSLTRKNLAESKETEPVSPTQQDLTFGLGLKTALRSSSGLLFEVKPQCYTRVISYLNFYESQLEFQKAPKHFEFALR